MERFTQVWETAIETSAVALGLVGMALSVWIVGLVVQQISHLGVAQTVVGCLSSPAAGFGFFVLPTLVAALAAWLGMALFRWGARRLLRRHLSNAV